MSISRGVQKPADTSDSATSNHGLPETADNALAMFVVANVIVAVAVECISTVTNKQ